MAMSSWFMTRLLHDFPDQNAFDAKMQAADRRYYLGRHNGNPERLPDGALACWQTHERAGAGQLPAADSPV